MWWCKSKCKKIKIVINCCNKTKIIIHVKNNKELESALSDIRKVLDKYE